LANALKELATAGCRLNCENVEGEKSPAGPYLEEPVTLAGIKVRRLAAERAIDYQKKCKKKK